MECRNRDMVMGPLKGHKHAVASVAFSPDGKRVISGSYDMTIRVWDAKTGEVVIGPLEGHQNRVHSVAVSPNGKQLVSGSEDRTIRVWDLAAADPIISPFPCFTDNAKMVEDWVLGPNSELLFWVPHDLQTGLYRPRNKAIIGRVPKTKLDLKAFVHGESWELCKK